MLQLEIVKIYIKIKLFDLFLYNSKFLGYTYNCMKKMWALVRIELFSDKNIRIKHYAYTYVQAYNKIFLSYFS